MPFTGRSYLHLIAAIRTQSPALHIHALSPEEVSQIILQGCGAKWLRPPHSSRQVLYGAKTARLSVPKFLEEAKAAGLNSLPGTSAEILDDTVRQKLAPGRLSLAIWPVRAKSPNHYQTPPPCF
jgi:FO synthase